MHTLLEVNAIHAGYGEIGVLHEVSLSIAKGGITTVIGSNGAGKTTLMQVLSGLVRSSSGQIWLGGEDISQLRVHQRVERGLVLVPEGRLVFPDMSVHDTLRIGAFASRAAKGWEQRREAMYEMFPRLKQRQHSAGGSLSGGEQQMLALARGLMAEPDILLLDEPSLGPSPIMADEVLERLVAIRAQGMTICLVEQNVFAALTIADYAYVLEDGRVALHGAAKDMMDIDKIRNNLLRM